MYKIPVHVVCQKDNLNEQCIPMNEKFNLVNTNMKVHARLSLTTVNSLSYVST